MECFCKTTLFFVRKTFVHRPLPRFRANFIFFYIFFWKIYRNSELQNIWKEWRLSLKRLKINFDVSMIFLYLTSMPLTAQRRHNPNFFPNARIISIFCFKKLFQIYLKQLHLSVLQTNLFIRAITICVIFLWC